jgi:hypothetical protein
VIRPEDYAVLEMAGRAPVLYRCPKCGAAVEDRDLHSHWHKKTERERELASAAYSGGSIR